MQLIKLLPVTYCGGSRWVFTGNFLHLPWFLLNTILSIWPSRKYFVPSPPILERIPSSSLECFHNDSHSLLYPSSILGSPQYIYIYIYIIFFNTSPTYNFFLSTSLMSKALRFDKIHYTSNSSQNRSTSCRFSPPHPLVITICSSQTFNLLHTSIEIGLVVHDKCDLISPAVLGSCFAILYIIT